MRARGRTQTPGSSPRELRRATDQGWAERLSDDVLRDASEQNPREPGPPVGAHRDDRGVDLACELAHRAWPGLELRIHS